MMPYEYKKIRTSRTKTVDEHRLVMGADGFNTIVHHKDGDKRNNDKENLEVMSRSEHAKLHGLGTKIRPASIIKSFEPDENGNARCRKCKQSKSWESFVLNSSYKNGRDSECKDCKRKRSATFRAKNKISN